MIVSYPVLCAIQTDPFAYTGEINAILESFRESIDIKHVKIEDVVELMVLYKTVLKMGDNILIFKMESIVDKLSLILLNGGIRDIKNFRLTDFINPSAIGVFND